MTWHVEYRDGTTDLVVRYPSAEQAIEAACRLIDEGRDVYGIGTGPLAESAGKETIARIYQFWAKANPHRATPPKP
jgi:hypothetical protein